MQVKVNSNKSLPIPMHTYDSRFVKEVVKTIKGVNMVSDIVTNFEIFFFTKQETHFYDKEND